MPVGLPQQRQQGAHRYRRSNRGGKGMTNSMEATAILPVSKGSKVDIGAIAVVVPARNEEEQIMQTIRSLQQQTRPPNRIVVVVNNSTDNTAYLAGCCEGVEVIVMQENRFKKAGALNAGVRYLTRNGTIPEFVVTIDADTILEAHCLERSFNAMRKNAKLGGLSVVCFGKEGLGKTPYQRFLTWTQRVEYSRAAWLRLRTNVHTLSGAGTVLRGQAILEVLEARGDLYEQRANNLVEDFEMTLELKRLGWQCTNNYHCIAYTDLMPTLRMLLTQRTRWVRGTVDELRRRGWCRETRGSIITLVYGLLSVPVYYLWPALIVYNTTKQDTDLKDFWILPFLGLYQALAVRKLGWLSMLAASLLVVDFGYGMLRHYWFLTSIAKSYLSTADRSDWKENGN